MWDLCTFNIKANTFDVLKSKHVLNRVGEQR